MKTEYQLQIISKLKTLREEKDITQNSIAKLLEISPGQLGNIESYKQNHKYTLKQIDIICGYLNYSISELFNGTKENNFDLFVKNLIKYEENE